MHWQQITLVGVGLLGGSLGLAIRKQNLARRVVGFVRRPESVGECEKAGVVDKAELDVLRAVEGSDLVILCTPIAQMRDLVVKMRPALKKGILITDVGSVKGKVIADLESLVAETGACFIGSHPMAGTEKTGVSGAKVDLFANAVCVVTPTEHSPAEAVERIEGFWRAVGGTPLRMEADLHDELVSRSSHLPHLVAATLANYVLSPIHPKEQAMLCATGFRDTTRIASGSPEMWRDICLANNANLARVLGVFIEDLQEFKLGLENGDVKGIEEFFKKAKQRRDAWRAAAAPSSTTPE